MVRTTVAPIFNIAPGMKRNAKQAEVKLSRDYEPPRKRIIDFDGEVLSTPWIKARGHVSSGFTLQKARKKHCRYAAELAKKMVWFLEPALFFPPKKMSAKKDKKDEKPISSTKDIKQTLAANLVYALEIWTQVFIRSLAAQSGEPDVAAEIASVLCASDDNKDNSNHDAGPNDIVGTFESLFYTGETEEEIQDITSRTRQLAAVFCIDKEYQGLRRLEEDHPLKPLLQETHTWCREEYQLMQEAEKEDS
ncbi:hypothetical protein E4U39_005108 [Claviceps sp. Clav50 group G5]|nr:hypothetical protein E4U39_005108 [Claviceps sp. Clav50 group G5]